jgi:hypothetical protein
MLAHVEFVIDLVTITSVIVIILKFVSVIVPPYIHFAVWFMISGWASIQLILALSHVKEVDSIPPATLVRRAFALEVKLRNPLIWTLLFLLLLPLFGYLSFAMCYQTTAMPMVIKEIFCILYVLSISMYSTPIWEDLAISILSCLHRRRRLMTCLSGLCHKVKSVDWIYLIRFILIWLVLEVLLILLIQSMVRCIECSSSQCCMWMCALIFVHMIVTFSLWFFFPTNLFRDSIKIWDIEHIQTPSLVVNLFTTVFIFAGAMMLYKLYGTYKLDWLDWLGKLNKWIRAA